MKLHRTILIVAVNFSIMLFSSSTSPTAQASPLVDSHQPPTIEQPERPIYEPLYFENHRLPGLPPFDQQIAAWEDANDYSARVVQNLDEHKPGKYNYEIYYYSDYNTINLTNEGTADDIFPKLNHGSSQLLFASDRTGNLELFRMNVYDSSLTQLTWLGEPDVRPDWSPDSAWIVWESYYPGQADIYIQNYAGDYVAPLTQHPAFDGMPAWSPDGSKIAFISNRTGGYRVYTMNTDGSDLTQLSDQPYSINPVWSPDGSKIAFSADTDSDGWLELWWMNADGSNEQLLYDSPKQNTDLITSGWAPFASVIAYTEVNYVSYHGNWYWTAAQPWGFNYEYNINPVILYSSDRAWNLDWQSTDGTSPVSAVIEPATSPQPYRFLVVWNVSDDKSGVIQHEVQYRVGETGDWLDWVLRTYPYDAYEWFEGIAGPAYYFRSRATDGVGNVEPWPITYDLAVTVETSPPVTTISPLPRYTASEYVYFSWDGYDPGESGIQYFYVEKWNEVDQTWTTWFISEWPTGQNLYGEPGHTYRLRTRGVDWAGNSEKPPFLGDTITTFYTYMAAGRVTDHTGTPVEGAQVVSNQEPFIVQSSDGNGNYLAYFDQPAVYQTLVLTKTQYADLPASIFMYNDEIRVDFVLPPSDSIVRDWGFEAPEPSLDWDIGGIYTPSLDSDYAHTGEQAAALGLAAGDQRTAYATQAGASWIAQSLSLPVTVTHPALSFIYITKDFTGDNGDVEILLTSDAVTSTLMTIGENTYHWEHTWVDLSAWSGEVVTLTYRLNQVSGKPLAGFGLDEVTIGQAHPDTWLSAEGDNTALPTEQFNLTLQYGNRGTVPAENSVLTLTLPAGLSFVSADPAPSQVNGDQVIWQLGDLPAGYMDGTIDLSLEMDSPGELGSWLTSQLILASQTTELELLNNQIEFKTYVGSLVTLPFTAK